MPLTFEQQYERLFGKKLEYDPISAPADIPEPRLDLTNAPGGLPPEPVSAPEPSKFNEIYKRLRTATPAVAPQEPPGMLGDVGRAVWSGVAQTGGMALGGLEYAARQAEDLVDAGIGREMLGDIRRGLTGARQRTMQHATNILQSMSPEAQDRIQRRILSLDPNQSVWRGGVGSTVASLGLKFSQALPATVLTLLPAARYFKAGMTPAALTYIGASEGGLSLGGIAAGIADEVEGMTDEELGAESPYYAALINQGMSSDDARAQTIAQAQGMAPLIGGLIVGVISATAGRYLEPVFTPGGLPLGQRFVRGFAAEAAQEAPQSGAEQVAQNISARIFDADRGATEGMAEAMAEGLVIGGLTGGGFTSVFGGGPHPQPPAFPPPTTELPPTEPTPGRPSPTVQREMFGPAPPGGEPFERVMPPEETPDIMRGSVSPELRAALDARMEGFRFVQPGELEAGARQLPLEGLISEGPRPSELRMPVVPPGQLELPLARREPGYRAAPVPPAVPPAAPPPSYARETAPLPGRPFEPRQIDIEGIQGPPGVPAAPTAEPVADIQAQLAEMQRPESDREAVYLSADNLATLQEQGQLEGILDSGVPLVNFDEQGGTLLARDRQVAESLVQLKEEGGNLEELIGTATTAGVGKPARGQLVVQRRNESGNVVQETLVASEPEAEQLAAQWERRFPNFDIQIMTATAAIGRRETLLARERAPLLRRKRRERALKRRGPQLEAARLVGQAARELAPQEKRRIGGFFPAAALEFEDVRERTKYERRFRELTEQELILEARKIQEPPPPERAEEEYREREAARVKARKRRGELLEELAEIRQRAKPRLKAEVLVSKARAVSPAVVKAVEAEARRRATREPEAVPKVSMEYDTDALRALTDRQIDVLRDEELENTFRNAVNWVLGFSRRGAELRYEGVERALPEILPEGAEFISVRTAGNTLEEILNAYNTPSEKRKFVRRVRNTLVRMQYSPVKGKPITREARQLKRKKGIFRRQVGRRGVFDTTVLSIEQLPKDESKGDRIKREAAARKARDRLDKTLRRAATHSERMNSGDFADIVNQRDESGELTDAARQMIHARAYFRVLADFATAMTNSKSKSKDIAREMERVDEILSNAVKMPAKDFSRVFAGLLKAETQTQIREIRAFTPEVREQLQDPETRAEANAKILQTLLADQARLSRLEEVWRENSYYNTVVGPLIHKFTDSTFRDGYPSYRPTEQEMERLKWVLNNWKIPRLRNQLYTPLRLFFTRLGFKWTPDGELIVPRNEDGKYEYHPADEALHMLYQAKFGNETEKAFPAVQEQQVLTELEHGPRDPNTPGAPRAVTEKKKYVRVRPGAPVAPSLAEQRRAERLTRERAERAADVVEWGRYAQANRIIEKFRAIIASPKTTVNGLIRSEERLIRAFKELEMWNQTSPKLGQIKFQAPRTYRIIGPRLQSKELRKEEARDLMLKALKPQTLPDWVREDEAIQARRQQPLRAETEMFLRTIEPGRGEAFQPFENLAGAINARLTENPSVPLNDLLDMVAASLPKGHAYTELAERMRGLNMDIPVSWDRRGQLGQKYAAAKWELDEQGRQFRYILMNQSKLGNSSDPTLATIHALLHESTHMATQSSLDRDVSVRGAVKSLREIARREWRRRNPGKAEERMPYGIKELNESEFVAEAFSNLRFQKFLKSIPYDSTISVWRKFVDLVRRIIGRERPPPMNVFEAISSLESPLFTGRYRVITGAPAEAFLGEIDPAVRDVASAHYEAITGSMDTLRRGWDRAKKLGVNAPLSLMTMRQIHKEFNQYFQGRGIEGKNSLDLYKEAWEQRDAENSRLMQIGSNLSREWTALTEKYGVKDALEFSRIGTEASLYGIHPSAPLSAEANEHVTSNEMKAKHAELSRRYNAMNQDWKSLWERVRKYYTEAIQDETNLILFNALRGAVATGRRSIMDSATFDKKYSPEKVSNLKSAELLRQEFPDLSDDQIGTLLEIISIPTIRKGPYFPMMRYGDYVVYASREAKRKSFSDRKAAREFARSQQESDPTTDVHVTPDGDMWAVVVTEKDFRTFETPSEAAEARLEMIEEYGAKAVSDVQKKDKFRPEDTIRSGSALASILDDLAGNTKAQNAVKDWWLRTLSDSSFRKHEIRRKNRRGVDYDLQHRNFTNYVKKSSYYRSQLRFGWRMADALNKLRLFVRDYKALFPTDPTNVRLGDIRDHLGARDRKTDDFYEVSKIIRRGSEVGQLFYLFGPSYWMINATQPYMVTLPWLGARYGWGASSAAMKNAQALIASPLLKATRESLGGIKAAWSKEAAERAFNVMDQIKEQITKRSGTRASQYNDMLEQLRRHNIIELSWITELRDISEGSDTSAWQKIVDGTRVLGHLTEVNNRVLTALAAYDLRYAEILARKGATHELAHSEAIEFSKDAVSETHFDYSAGNKPLLFQPRGPFGQAAPWVFQFMQWPQHMYALLISNMASLVRRGAVDRTVALKTLAGIFGTHILAGGLVGATLQPIKWAIGLALWALGDDDEPETLKTAISGEAFERWMRESAVELAGPRVGHAIASGIPAGFLGVDISRRVDLGTVYYLDLRTDSAEATLGSLTMEFSGAVPNLAFGVLTKAIPTMLSGDIQRGAEYAMPKFARDLSRAWRLSQDGLVNNAGDTVIPTEGISPWQVFLQATGFQSSELSDHYARQALVRDTLQYGEDRRNSLLRRFRTAQSIEERSRVLEEVREFNKAFPHARITRSSLIRSMRGQEERETSYRRYGVNLRGRDIMLRRVGEYYE
jgi:hypothetical protein